MINKISIKFTVVSLFLFLAILLVSLILYVQYIFSQELAHKSIDDQLKILSSKVEDNITSINTKNSHIIDTLRIFFKGKDIKSFQKNRELYLEVFSQVLTNNKNIYAMYIGFYDNSFFELINLNIDTQLKQKYDANKDDQWLLIEIVDNIKTLYLINHSLKITSRQHIQNNYFATKRPWYQKAMKENSLIKTSPYSFSNINAKGVTYAKIIPETKNVLGLDLLINNFNNILEESSGHILQNIYMFDNSGETIAQASNNINDLQILNTIKTQIKQSKPKETILEEYSFNNKKYIYSIVPIGKDFLCIYSKTEEILAPYTKKIYIMFVIISLILLLVAPIILYFSSIIVKPILLLAKENTKIKNREFEKVKPVATHVLEVHTLSNSLVSMAQSIHQYQTELEEKVKMRTFELQKKNKELEKLSITDKLTGLYNRIKLDTTIDIEIEKAKRYNTTFGIIIIDIDFFKNINDTFGHQVGDRVLIEFAKILQTGVRKTDIVGRWGGEEFIVICIESSLKNILPLAEKLREQIANFVFSTVKYKTASFGVATYSMNETAQEMLNRADQALYSAKQNGRNSVETLEKI